MVMIVVNPNKSKDKKDENEFDVIEIYIEDDKTKCNIYACSIGGITNRLWTITKLAETIHYKYQIFILKLFM
jgi:hypothetical protein